MKIRDDKAYGLAFDKIFFGASIPWLLKQDQLEYNKLFKQRVEDMPMARKTAKTTRKPAKRWVAKTVKDKVIAEHVSGPEPTAGDTDYAIPEASPQVWFDGPQGPGLHVMRIERGDHHEYSVVCAVFINDGLSQCYEMRWPGGCKIDMTEFTNPNFQKVSE